MNQNFNEIQSRLAMEREQVRIDYKCKKKMLETEYSNKLSQLKINEAKEILAINIKLDEAINKYREMKKQLKEQEDAANI